ncbi:MAG: hypothetical protein WDZ93_02965 [Candidatus Paceibacterota bacterium]
MIETPLEWFVVIIGTVTFFAGWYCHKKAFKYTMSELLSDPLGLVYRKEMHNMLSFLCFTTSLFAAGFVLNVTAILFVGIAIFVVTR